MSQAGFWSRHRWLKWVCFGVLAGLAVLTGIVLVLAHRAGPMLRAGIVQELEDHFHAHVELDSFHVTLRNGLWAEGKGLRIWPPAQDVESGASQSVGEGSTALGSPLIQLKDFKFHAPLHFNPGKPIHISVVQLAGLEVDVPPRSRFEKHDRAKADANQSGGGTNGKFQLIQLDNIDCTDALLTMETDKPGKLPLQFAIAHVRLANIQSDEPMSFQAELTNPRPQGIIHSSGKFGPWAVGDPGETPVMGVYEFDHADLSDFKGIAGILSSTGNYTGTLRNLTVDGETETPDFRLTHFGTGMDLHTKFHAKVDGINGDTWLEPVEAKLGGSQFVVRGKVVRVADDSGGKDVDTKDGNDAAKGNGHDIAMKVDIENGRIEDFLRLASHTGTPFLTGALKTKAEFDIMPGPASVEERLKLKGTFALDGVQFTSDNVQNRVADLSARGQGHPNDAKSGNQDDVRSTMNGNFQMAGGVVTLSALEYTVPGAVIDLKGRYEVEGGKLDFMGDAKMDATVSAMVGGWKGFLLKPLDKIFQKDGAGTRVPIHIDGTRDHPHFGVDFNRMKKSSPERPDEPKSDDK